MNEQSVIRVAGALGSMSITATGESRIDDAATLAVASNTIRVLWTEVVKLRAELEKSAAPPPAEAGPHLEAVTP